MTELDERMREQDLRAGLIQGLMRANGGPVQAHSILAEAEALWAWVRDGRPSSAQNVDN